uniref:Uncharacterized protein n=1 Tax=Rhizophagus irregularis (strain DAOM 181602 / DAOM 197198 / MUCL 43194) TaxID=747089 RepID=U9U3N3_RHIID
MVASYKLTFNEQEEKEIPAQDQPSQDKPELSQELSPLPYTLYENDTHYTIIIYTPCIISKNQLTIGVEYNKLLVIEGSSYVNDESNKYGKVIKNMAPRTRFEDSAYY